MATVEPFVVTSTAPVPFAGWREVTIPVRPTNYNAWRYVGDTRTQAAFVGSPIGLDGRRAYVLLENCPPDFELHGELFEQPTPPTFQPPSVVPIPQIAEQGRGEIAWLSDQTITEGPLAVRRLVGRSGPFVCTMIAYCFADEPWTPFEVSWLHSDPRTEALQADHGAVFAAHADAYVHVYGPTFTSLASKLAVGWSRALWNADTLGNGQGQTAARGVLLHYLHARKGRETQDLQSMDALQRGDVRAVAASWNGSCGPFRAVPALSPFLGNGRQAAIDRYQKWQDDVASKPLEPWAITTMGMRGNPGGTGAQEDFPVGPAPEVLSPVVPAPYNLAELEAAGYGELRRPIHYREANGVRIDPDAHPDWKSWCQQTHFHPTVSPDRLGKPEWWGPMETHGYLGRDQQHNSINRLGAAVLIGGSRLLEDELRDHIVHFRAASFDAANRARGRNMHAGAWLHRLTADPKLLAAMKALAQANADSWPSRGAGAPWAIDCSSFSEPDPRDLGGRTPFWVGWAESLCAPGLYLGYKETGSEVLLDLVKRSLKTLMLYGWFKRDGLPGWRIANGITYRGFKWDPSSQTWLPDGTQGQALPPEAYADPLQVEDAGGGFELWAYPAVTLALRLLPEDAVIQQRCVEIIAQVVGSREKTDSFDDMDRWMAVG